MSLPPRHRHLYPGGDQQSSTSQYILITRTRRVSYVFCESICRQLRDLMVCPHEPGVVDYIQNESIVRHSITSASVSMMRTHISHLHELRSKDCQL